MIYGWQYVFIRVQGEKNNTYKNASTQDQEISLIVITVTMVYFLVKYVVISSGQRPSQVGNGLEQRLVAIELDWKHISELLKYCKTC